MSRKRAKRGELPGCLYQRNGRWYWKVRLPGESKVRGRALRPRGAPRATRRRDVAEHVAREMYERAAAGEWTGTVADLAKAYSAYAKGYYHRPDGEASTEIVKIEKVLSVLLEHCATTEAADFGPRDLKAVRQALIDADLARTTVNERVNIIKRMYKWATEEERVPASTWQALLAVEGLKRGRSGAKETEPVKPVPEAWVEKTLPYLPPVVADMVRVQLLTGMRSGELCQMRPADLDTSGKVWLYRPRQHKNAYRGHARVISIGPKAQAILERYLHRDLQAPMFSPAESEKRRLAAQHKARTTPLKHGNRPGTNRKALPKRKPRTQYDTTSYRRAVKRAIGRGNREIKARLKARGLQGDDLEKACEREKIPHWHPHQLRHTAATRIRKAMGLDAARAVLGHRTISVTNEYAELDRAKASDAALKSG